MKRKVDEVLRALINAANPELLGRPKNVPFRGCFAYELGSKHRVLYRVNRVEKKIDFLRTCSTKRFIGPRSG